MEIEPISSINDSISIINNPFIKNSISRIYVNYYYCNIFNCWKANGLIEFTNGNTKGEQKFTGQTFDDIVTQIKALVNELTEKQTNSK